MYRRKSHHTDHQAQLRQPSSSIAPLFSTSAQMVDDSTSDTQPLSQNSELPDLSQPLSQPLSQSDIESLASISSVLEQKMERFVSVQQQQQQFVRTIELVRAIASKQMDKSKLLYKSIADNLLDNVSTCEEKEVIEGYCEFARTVIPEDFFPDFIKLACGHMLDPRSEEKYTHFLALLMGQDVLPRITVYLRERDAQSEISSPIRLTNSRSIVRHSSGEESNTEEAPTSPRYAYPSPNPQMNNDLLPSPQSEGFSNSDIEDVEDFSENSASHSNSRS